MIVADKTEDNEATTAVSRHGSEQNGTTTVPTLGFGTYRTGGYKCYNAVKNALDCGYTHIDTAMAYENEAAVGRAIEQSSVDREDIFLTTKIKGYPEMVEYERLIEAAKGCLERLGTEYLDLLLVHWWNPLADMEETFNALNTLVDDGLVGQIGVSNFSIKELKQAMRLSDAPIATNQIEYHPYWGDEELVRFCQDNDVTVTASVRLRMGELLKTTPAFHSRSYVLTGSEDVPVADTAVECWSRFRSCDAALGWNIDVFGFELAEPHDVSLSELKPRSVQRKPRRRVDI